MNAQELITKSSLHDWVDEETRHIGVIASWENLCSAYEAMRFTDELTDAERLEEYKWIVHMMNVFLTKIRTQLLTCQDRDAMFEVLKRWMEPVIPAKIPDRKTLAYHKLKQQWILNEVSKLSMMEE